MGTAHKIRVFFEGGRPHVDKPTLTVRFADTIEWKSQPKARFILNFRDGTPFGSERLLYVDEGSTVQTVERRKQEEVVGYKYSVILHGEVLDPIIIVDPR